MAKKIEKTQYHSYKIGLLPKGCKLCVKGRKLVLFITGLCDRGCFYCPISDEKKGRDVVYANEWNTEYSGGEMTEKELDAVMEEARLSGAEGAGVTGGDPLLVVERTAKVIKALKNGFGRRFHIHLYASLENVTKEKLRLLYDAGLDEIRFHPDLEDDSLWDRILLAKGYRWDVGVEVPVIPGYEEKIKKLLDFLEKKIDFLNLNELELSDNTASRLPELGYKARHDETYAVEGSQELAMKLMEYVLEKGYGYSVHFCTVRLKDGVQMASRIKHRSKKAASDLDSVTPEGMLVRGAIYLSDLAPGFGYRKKIKEMKRDEKQKKIEELTREREKIMKELSLRQDELRIDDYKLRLLTSEDIARKNAKRLKEMDYMVAVVEEYPTKDALEVDVEFL